MGKEYRAKVFKSGNSLALRLPKELGLKEGSTMVLREERAGFLVEPEEAPRRKIDISHLVGSIPGLSREPFEYKDRDWSSGKEQND